VGALVALAACTGPVEDGDSPADDTERDGGVACFADEDLDGFGDATAPVGIAGDGGCGVARVADATDCDDGDDAISPAAPEVCNGADDDCDGQVDDADDDLADGLPFYADADGDGYGADAGLITACAAGGGAALHGGDCDDADPAVSPGAIELCDDIDQDCDGTAGDALGASAECAATSCLAVRESGGSATDGTRWLALPSGAVAEVWCDMTTDGGGWTLGFLRNTASTGSQGGFGGGEQALDQLGVSGEAASTSSEAHLAWLDLNTFPYTDLHLAAYASGSQTYLSREIPHAALRIAFGADGYLLWGGDTGYYWCGGNATYTDAGVGATDNPAGATLDCKGHGSLGSGWDFSEVDYPNAGLTLCGGDGSSFLAASWGGTWTWYGAAGGAQAIWVR
jgi:hypothetical protein